MTAELFTRFNIEAARYLTGLPADHKCSRMHGHTFEITITVSGPVDQETGWVMDFAKLAGIAENVRASLDHSVLNEVEGLNNPTTENIAKWIWDRSREYLPELAKVQVCENSYSGCIYTGE